MTEQQPMHDFLDSTLELNRYYNFLLLPFDYVEFMKKPIIQEQIKALHQTDERYREMEKNKLQKIIYTELYKLNIKSDDIKDYFQKAILTEKFQKYLGVAFKYSIQYNRDEDPYVTTFIHMAQLYMADLAYEYLWKLDHSKKAK